MGVYKTDYDINSTAPRAGREIVAVVVWKIAVVAEFENRGGRWSRALGPDASIWCIGDRGPVAACPIVAGLVCWMTFLGFSDAVVVV
jgi:hypothetical protein